MMIRLIWRRIVGSVSLLVLVSVSYLLLSSSPPPPLRYRGTPGLTQGYRDCHPAHKFVLVHNNTVTDSGITVLEQILSNFALKHQLNTGRISTVNFTILFVGMDENSVNSSSMFGLRESLGEETYIVTVADQTLAKRIGADFNFIVKAFKQSLLVLRHLLCMEFRDIIFHDKSSKAETSSQYEENDFQNVISYIGEDYIKRQMKLFDTVLKKAKIPSVNEKEVHSISS